MIEITGSLAHPLKTIFRRAITEAGRGTDHRKYLRAVLRPSEAIKAVRRCSAFENPSPSKTQTQEDATIAKAEDTPEKDPQPNATSSTEELIDAAEQLKASLRDTLGKTSELIVGLKRHRKEAKIVRTTLDSPRQLQTVG